MLSGGSSADLGVSGSGSPDPATGGATVTYSMQVSNNGPADAQDVVFIAQVVGGTTFVNLIANANWNCLLPAPGATGQVKCTRPTLAAGVTSPLTLAVRVDTGRTADLATSFNLSSSTADPSMSNNDITLTTHIGGAGSAPPTNGLPYRRVLPQVAQD